MSPAALPHRVIYWYVYKWRSISFEERVKHLIFEGLLAVSDWEVEVIPKLKILLYNMSPGPITVIWIWFYCKLDIASKTR